MILSNDNDLIHVETETGGKLSARLFGGFTAREVRRSSSSRTGRELRSEGRSASSELGPDDPAVPAHMNARLEVVDRPGCYSLTSQQKY